MEEEHKVYGIDFGNSYVRISRLNSLGKAIVVDNLEGDSKTPAIVGFGKEGSGEVYTFVGEVAECLESIDLEAVCSNVRRKLTSVFRSQGF